MMLTGKARESFESYFLAIHEDERYEVLKPKVSLLEAFNQLPLSMQLGVYIDWFDTVNVQILIVLNNQMNFTYLINGKHCDKEEGYRKRNDARIAALGKAVYLFNKRHEDENERR